ncbi:spore coat protein [Cohnella kolymensis]|uniref:spore coat protein n=1 Tax=Cohnella kolymensis TaxID=1590652 RepID=UPI0009E2C451|nr:spore coat protein [Cohnella kolymensis]
MPYGAHEAMETNEILLEKINMITHFNLYARETNNPQLQDMISRHLDEEIAGYNEIVRYTHDYTFSPVPPNTDISGVTPQSIQYGLNNPPQMAPQSGTTISDREIAIGMLCCHKNAARNAIWASLECADPNLRQLLMNSSANCVRQAYEVFLFMNEQGLYQVPTLNDHTAKTFLHRYQPSDGNGQFAGQSAMNSDNGASNWGSAAQFGQSDGGMAGQFGRQGAGYAGGQFGQQGAGFGMQNAGYGQQSAGYGQQNAGFGQQNIGYGAQSGGYAGQFGGQQNAGFGAQRGMGAQFSQQGVNYAAQFGQPTVGYGGPFGQTSRPYPGQMGPQAGGFSGQFGQQGAGSAGQFGQQGAGSAGQSGQQNAGRSMGANSSYGTQSFASGSPAAARGNGAAGGNTGVYSDTGAASNTPGFAAAAQTGDNGGTASSAQNWTDETSNSGSNDNNGGSMPQ